MAMVKFLQGTSAQYGNLATKDPNTLYFLTDTYQIMKGANAYTEKVIVKDSLPASGIQGVLYINATEGLPYYWNGSEFKKLSVALVTTISESSTDTEAPSAKAVKTYVDTQDAATLEAAKKYADDQDAIALAAAKKYTDDEIDKLDGSAVIATESDNVVTIKAGIIETDGVVAQGEGADITLAKVAKTGTAADVAVVDEEGLLASDNVEAALAELAGKVSSASEAGVVTVEKTVGGEGDTFASKYTFKQGGVAIPNGEITIGKDMVATNGELVTEDGEGNTGTFIKMTIANGEAFYINVVDLIEYNSVESTDEITLTDTNHKISATVGQIAASKITHGETTVEAALTAAEATIAKLDGADTVEGSVAKALKDAKAYADQAEADAITSANAYTDAEIQKLDADLDATGTAAKGGVFVVSGVTQVDGVITAVDSVEVEQAGAAAAVKTELVGTADDTKDSATIAGAKKYADAAKAAVVGTEGDDKSANTIWGAKAYADDKLNVALEGANEALIGSSSDSTDSNTIWGAKNFATAKVEALDASTTASEAAADTTSADNGVSVVATVTQTDGLVAMETVKADKYGAASKALTDANAYTDNALTWKTIE